MKKKRKYIYLEKCLIIRILQIYIFSFYDFLFFISLSDTILIVAFVCLQMCWYGVNYLPAAQDSMHVYANL